ncbi:MAG TPA: WYL domain-containing protein, partial [Phototrophicaceae bacterium]|nr:WYL domain-containing protein [Phototrophicaceae bacterium]
QKQGKMTAQALAEELEVSGRTILRDVDALSTAGIPIYADGGHGGGIMLDEKYRTTLTGLKESEVQALFISSNAHLLKDIGLGDAAEGAALKLFAALPAVHQPTVEFMRQRIHIDPLWWWHDSQRIPFWDVLQQAVYEDRQLQVVYENHQGKKVERTLEPYSLVAKSSLWYLIARREGEFRTYRVSRFYEVRLNGEHFQRQPDFDLPTYWQAHLQEFVETLSDYHFTLQVDPDRLNFLQRLIPGRYQIMEELPDDRSWITIKFQVESPDLARMLVFELGAQAVVLEPQELQTSVLKTARELLNWIRIPGTPD